jgi:hypothetical protein
MEHAWGNVVPGEARDGNAKAVADATQLGGVACVEEDKEWCTIANAEEVEGRVLSQAVSLAFLFSTMRCAATLSVHLNWGFRAPLDSNQFYSLAEIYFSSETLLFSVTRRSVNYPCGRMAGILRQRRVAPGSNPRNE